MCAKNTNAMSARPELIQMAEFIAKEKGLSKSQVLEALEQAIQKAGRSKYGADYDIRTSIDPETGEISMLQYQEVVNEVENEYTEITLDRARRVKPNAKIGDFLISELPPIDFGRIAAQTARQVIIQRVRDAERMRYADEYRERIGKMITAKVKRVDYNNIYLELDKIDGVIRRDCLLPRERYHVGDEVKAVIVEVVEEQRGPQVYLSRTSSAFLAALMRREIPEVDQGVVDIKAIARDPGSRSKVAVYSKNSDVEAVAVCIGVKGSRVQAIIGELRGEKLEIINYSANPAAFVVSSLAPAEVSKVVIDEDAGRVDVLVSEDQLSLAIGRRGQNVRLASKLTGYTLNIMTEKDFEERQTKLFDTRSTLFQESLDVDDTISELLVAYGYASVEELADSTIEELLNLEGFNEDIADEILNRAKTYVKERDDYLNKKIFEYGVSDDLVHFSRLSKDQIVALGDNNIRSLREFAELSSDELVEILPDFFNEEEASQMIMMARDIVFD